MMMIVSRTAAKLVLTSWGAAAAAKQGVFFSDVRNHGAVIVETRNWPKDKEESDRAPRPDKLSVAFGTDCGLYDDIMILGRANLR